MSQSVLYRSNEYKEACNTRKPSIFKKAVDLKLQGKQKMLELLQEGVLSSKKLWNWWQIQSSVDQNLAQHRYKLPVKKEKKKRHMIDGIK